MYEEIYKDADNEVFHCVQNDTETKELKDTKEELASILKRIKIV